MLGRRVAKDQNRAPCVQASPRRAALAAGPVDHAVGRRARGPRTPSSHRSDGVVLAERLASGRRIRGLRNAPKENTQHSLAFLRESVAPEKPNGLDQN